MLFIFWILLTLTSALENEHCDSVVLLTKGELIALPNNPFEVPNMKCRWTVVAEPDRQIVFACVSYMIPDSAKKNVNVCYGKFTVAPEGENETSYCHDRTFSRVGESNRMTITYDRIKGSSSESDVSGFACFLYAEIGSDVKVTEEIDSECNYNIALEENDLVRLENPKYEDPGCRWNVVAPPDGKVTLTCPFTDKPPEPLEMQVLPCTGTFSVTFQDETQTHNCTEQALSITSSTNEMTVSYSRPLSKRYEDYRCYVVFESKSDESDFSASPYKNCDEYIELSYNDARELSSPNFPEKFEPGSACRWDVASTPHSRIVLNCLFPGITDASDVTNENESGSCETGLTVHSENEEEIHHCRITGFYQFSTANSMFLTYKTPATSHDEVFQCRVTSEAMLPNCDDCTGLNAFDFKGCKETITITKPGEIAELTIPETTCLWTVIFPAKTTLYLSCSFPNQTTINSDCKGYFTVYPTGKFEEAVMYCNDVPFSVKADGLPDEEWSKMFITYSGHELRQTLNCSLAVFTKTCYEKMIIHDSNHHVYYNYYQEVRLPFWPTDRPPWSSCTWIIKTPWEPVHYQIILKCNNNETVIEPCPRPLYVSPSGDLTINRVFQYCLDTPSTHRSYYNLLNIKYDNIPETSKPYDLIGCRAFASQKPNIEWDLCECGRSKIHTKNSNNRIANGESTLPEEFPMMAGLVNMIENNTMFCGGTIISTHYVLTAAACVSEADRKKYQVGVIVAASDRSPEADMTIPCYAADQLIAHEGYKAEPHLNDIGLVHVQEQINFNELVGPVCFPFFEKNHKRLNYFEQRTIHALGWGQRNNSDANFLMKMEALLVSDRECRYFNKKLDRDQHICIDHKNENVCSLDTGGPVLFVDHRTNRIKLLGILFTRNQCEGIRHTKATDILYFLDWIKNNTPGVTFCETA